jgi:hydrogenase 3 maturation protease
MGAGSEVGASGKGGKGSALKRTVVCGIGNTLRGDDGAGPMVIKGLRRRLGGTDAGKRGGNAGVLLLDCGSAPENFSGKVLEFGPEKVIIIDAVEMGRRPGAVDEIGLERVKKAMATTHKMPVTVFIEYLQRSLPAAEIVFIGIQQKSTGFGAEMSSEVGKAAGELIRNLGAGLEG